MYRKRLANKGVLHFRYAPPMTDFDVAKGDRPNPPFRGAPLECCSVYYYWWAFLKESTAYIDCCERGGKGRLASLYADFGDVRGKSFMKWWREGARLLFSEPDVKFPVVHEKPPISFDHKTEVLMVISLATDPSITLDAVRQVLKDEIRKRDGVKRGGPRYPVHTMPVLTSLHQTLMVWQAKKRLPEGATLVQIGLEAGLASTRIYGGNDKTTYGLTATKVHRCLTAAECLIANVAQGRFPDVSEDKSKIKVKSVSVTKKSSAKAIVKPTVTSPKKSKKKA